MSQTVKIKLPIRMGINYGLNKVRFPSAVLAGSKVRARATLQSLDEIPGGQQLVWNITVEREGADKPCCVAEWLVRYTCKKGHGVQPPGCRVSSNTRLGNPTA